MMSEGSPAIAATIRRAILRSDRSQADIAQAAGLSAETVSRFVNRHRQGRLGTLLRLAAQVGFEIAVVPKRGGRRVRLVQVGAPRPDALLELAASEGLDLATVGRLADDLGYRVVCRPAAERPGGWHKTASSGRKGSARGRPDEHR